jgi:hypothetical protein
MRRGGTGRCPNVIETIRRNQTVCDLGNASKPVVCDDAACPTSSVNIEETAPTPWKRIRADLARQLQAGVLERGDEVVIAIEAADHGVTHRTARRAVLALVEEGKLISQRRTDGRLGFIVRGDANMG